MRVAQKKARVGTYTYLRSHFVGANLGEISSHYAVVKSVEEKQQAPVHGHIRWDHKQEIQAE